VFAILRGANGRRHEVAGSPTRRRRRRESPAFKLIELLEKRGAACHDPFVPVDREHSSMTGRKSVPLDLAGVAGYDAVLIVTDHDCIDYVSLANSARLIVDTLQAAARSSMPRSCRYPGSATRKRRAPKYPAVVSTRRSRRAS
jgi:UDP-N-acetyl-D-glucosamine dehydrogenase